MAVKSKLVINYPQRRGYILQAHKLNKVLAACFDINIEVAEQNNDRLTLSFNGETIYSEGAREDAQIDFNRIAELLCRYQKPVGEISKLISESTEGDEPGQDQWFNSVCSGE